MRTNEKEGEGEGASAESSRAEKPGGEVVVPTGCTPSSCRVALHTVAYMRPRRLSGGTGGGKE